VIFLRFNLSNPLYIKINFAEILPPCPQLVNQSAAPIIKIHLNFVFSNKTCTRNAFLFTISTTKIVGPSSVRALRFLSVTFFRLACFSPRRGCPRVLEFCMGFHPLSYPFPKKIAHPPRHVLRQVFSGVDGKGLQAEGRAYTNPEARTPHQQQQNIYYSHFPSPRVLSKLWLVISRILQITCNPGLWFSYVFSF
jgi:hypothetical protein